MVARTAGSADPVIVVPTRTTGGDHQPVGPSSTGDAGQRTGSASVPHIHSAGHLPSSRPPAGSISPLDRPYVAIRLDGPQWEEPDEDQAPLLDTKEIDEERELDPVQLRPQPVQAPSPRRSLLRLVLLLAAVVTLGTLAVRSSIPRPGHAMQRMRHAHQHNAHSPAQAVAMANIRYHNKPKKTNVIFMISDGYGPASETFTRAFVQALGAKQAGVDAPEHVQPDQLPLDKLLVGQHRSMSTDSLITDSAAGATAFGSAVKSYNGAIGVVANVSGPGGTSPVATLFEAAKVQRELLTGVVVTTRLTDATPACFISHADDRSMEPLIAEHIVRGSLNGLSTRPSTKVNQHATHPRTVDLAIGGGACAFLPSTHPLSCRKDNADLLDEARADGWNVAASWLNKTQVKHTTTEPNVHSGNAYVPEDDLYVTSKDDNPLVMEPLAAKTKSGDALPFLGLLAPLNTPYEVDRLRLISDSERAQQLKARWPSLEELALGAINALHDDQSNKNGFMLMIEGSQIDLCAHENDPACHAFEAVAYQKTIKAVTEWIDAHNNDEEETIMVSTSDHETGGLTLGRQLKEEYPNYAYYPERSIYAKASAATLGRKLLAHVKEEPVNLHDPVARSQLEDYVRENVLGSNGAGFGSKTGGSATDKEVAAVLDCIATTETSDDVSATTPPIDPYDTCRRAIADQVSRRVEVGWSTQGHTGVDINVYAHGAESLLAGLKGNIDNTDIAKHIARKLDLDLAAITAQLQTTYN